LSDAESILSAGRGLEVFCNDTIQVVRTLMHVRACGVDSPIVDVPAAGRDAYVKLAGQFELSHYVQMIAMLEELRRNVRYSGAGRALTDALMVRLARMQQWASIEQLLGQLPAGGTGPPQKKKPPPSVAARRAAASPRPVTTPRSAQPHSVASPRSAEPPIDQPSDYADTPETVGVANGCEPAKAVAPEPLRGAPGRMPVTADQRERILGDPLVQQTLELFDGAVINMEREIPAAAPEADQSTE
jgi:DNA polymerase III gamma/tau subunit